jgi:hypothetical protein
VNRKRAALIDQLEASGKDFLWSVGQVSELEVQTAPAPGEWTVHQIAAHMRDTEQRAFLVRAQRMVTTEHPRVESFDQESYNREHYDPNEPMKKILTEFRSARGKLVRLARGAPKDAWDNWAVHPEFGKITLGWLLQYTHSHTLEHSAEISRRRAVAMLKETNRE